jgi:hypothetical protein
MISREDLAGSELLEEYMDTGYRNYRQYLAVKAQLQKRRDMAPANAEGYDKVLGTVAADYANQSVNLKRNAQKMLQAEAEKIEAALAEAEAGWWERLRRTVDDGSASAHLLAARVRKADWGEIERLFDEGDKWTRSVIAMTVDEPTGAGHDVYERIIDTVRSDHADPQLEDLEERAHAVMRAKREIPMLDPLAHAKAQDDALGGVAGIHEQALRADVNDFDYYERHKAAETIDDNWTRLTASLPADWEAEAAR